MTAHAHALLCGLSAVAFAAGVAGWRGVLHWLLGLVFGLLLFAPWLSLNLSLLPVMLPPTQAALLLALALLWQLWRPRAGVAAMLAGVMTAWWMLALDALGLPSATSFIVPCVSVMATLWLACRRGTFAAAELRTEAFMLLLPLAFAVATLPDLVDGWRSAAALQGMDGAAQATVNAGWSGLMVAVIALLSGFLYRGWKYR
ncbi:MAG TPA: hypothetical protein VMH83_03660 [Candidatus Acidoferrum sp.]|nr:hypothetical protein [Candidatus Acidoferrum sp.]